MKHVILALAASLTAGSASAAVVSWEAVLDQAQEVPAPIAVDGAGGFAFGTLDTDSNLLTWDIAFSGLSGPLVGLHFHAPAAAGATAAVVVNVGDISGLDSPSVGSTTLPDIGTETFLAGLYYVNAHTDLNPSGEIRGQVLVEIPAAIPVPAALPLALTGLGAIGLFGRRRRT